MYAEESWSDEAFEAERVAVLTRIEARAARIAARVEARQAENTHRRWSRDHGTHEPDHLERQAGEAAVTAAW